VDLQDRVVVALISKQKDWEAYDASVSSARHKLRRGDAADLKLPAVFDIEAGKIVDLAGLDLSAYLYGLADKTFVPELSLMAHADGQCAESDRRYCLLAMLPSDDTRETILKSLQDVDKEFRKEPRDILQVVYVNIEADSGMRGKLQNLLEAVGCSRAPRQAKCCSAFLWRPMWRRLEPFCGQIDSSQELLTFVRSMLFKAAVDGNAGLSHEHNEL